MSRRRRKNKPKAYIDDIPIFAKMDKRTGETVSVAYFDLWCQNQIGAKWGDQYSFMLETLRTSIIEIEEYWQKLRRDFYRWCQSNGLQGWGVHLYDERERRIY